MSSDLLAWGVPRLAQLLPLDDESLTQIITYSAGLSKEASAEHLKNLLGDSPAALEFIASFNSRRDTSRNTNNGGSNEKSGAKKNKKYKPPLHSAGPLRQPEGYGNVAGGYVKASKEEEYMSASSSRERNRKDKAGPSASTSKTQLLYSEPAALQVPQSNTSPYTSSAGSSRNQSPASSKQTTRNPPTSAGPLISDFLPNVKSKSSKSTSRQAASGTSMPSSKGSVTTNNIADLTAAIAALEISTNPTLGQEGRKCNCYASFHPLFTPAPNCLNCGKIICSLEGLQPCSFCGTPLLSSDEVQNMIRELRAERGQEKMRAHNESVQRDGGPGPAGSLPANDKLDAARAHRDRLLQFQAQNARRTRVVDEAADFETPNVASTLWMSPAQRALALKKQQRIQREIEEKARPEWEKKKTLMSLDIKGGRITRVYHTATGPAEQSSSRENEVEDAEEEELRDAETTSSKPSGGEAFSKNPLLAAGGLFRPIWKAPEGKQSDRTTGNEKEGKQTWRRVQDDRDDNEQWILDGGLHGYTT